MFTLQAGAVHGVAHTLKAEGFDASEDGTGRGTPLVPVKWPAEIAPTLNASFGDKQGLEDQHALNGGGFLSLAKCITAKSQRNDHETETLIPTRQGGFFDDAKAIGLQDDTTPKFTKERIGAQRADAGGEGACVAYSIQERAVSENPSNGPQGKGFQEGVAYTLEARHHCQAVAARMSVRRLTPTECERLQGFPDGYTDIPWRLHKEAQKKGVSYESLLLSKGITLREPAGEICPDGPRYKALGNSMAVPCMAWIGQRIASVHNEPLCLDE